MLHIKGFSQIVAKIEAPGTPKMHGGCITEKRLRLIFDTIRVSGLTCMLKCLAELLLYSWKMLNLFWYFKNAVISTLNGRWDVNHDVLLWLADGVYCIRKPSARGWRVFHCISARVAHWGAPAFRRTCAGVSWPSYVNSLRLTSLDDYISWCKSDTRWELAIIYIFHTLGLKRHLRLYV